MKSNLLVIGLLFISLLAHSQNGNLKTTAGTANNLYYKDGKLGIGAVNPRVKFEISSELVTPTESQSARGGLLITDGSGIGMSLGVTTTDQWTYPGWIQVNNTVWDVYYPLLLNPNGGKVGIGTTIPRSIFDINDNGAGSSSNTTTVTHGLTIGAKSTGGVLNMGINGNGAFYSWIQSRQFNSADFYNLALNPSGGKVGIGTTNFVGTHKLYVAGSVLAEEVQVKLQANWPDFVFNEQYNLMPLTEVESFIEKNNHLPDIPSETEVKENGINIGDMNAKLLQKIEELTLYMIEQNKKTDKIIEENKSLKKEIEVLKLKVK